MTSPNTPPPPQSDPSAGPPAPPPADSLPPVGEPTTRQPLKPGRKPLRGKQKSAPTGSPKVSSAGSATRPLRPIPVAASATVTPGKSLDSSSKATVATPIPIKPSAGNGVRVTETDGEEDLPVSEIAIRSAPPWLVSAVVHMMLLILLALATWAASGGNQVEIQVSYSEELGEQLEEDLLQMPQFEVMEIIEPVFAKDLTLVDDPLAAPPELDLSLDVFDAASDIEAPSIGMALTGREKGAKKALLAAYGGTGTTEAAVQAGLEWLAKQQDPRSGMWSLKGPYADGGVNENSIAATAMALLALQGAGHTHQTGEFKRNVARGANALVDLQNDEGCFITIEMPSQTHFLYSQAQASIAICELYGMTQDRRFRRPAQRAIGYAARVQSPGLGGWRYYPKRESDTSVTGWFVMALQSGRMAGLDVPSPTLDAITGFLDRVTDDGVLYSYRPGEEARLTMTAEALLCRQYLGWEHDDPRLLEGVDYVLDFPVDYEEKNAYYWYYATQVMHHMGGEPWERWNNIMREVVPAQQEKTGVERGSWDPHLDLWEAHGGRLYSTCFSIYMLEVYYRHLPIYKH